jgi:hypothetical protein
MIHIPFGSGFDAESITKIKIRNMLALWSINQYRIVQ